MYLSRIDLFIKVSFFNTPCILRFHGFSITLRHSNYYNRKISKGILFFGTLCIYRLDKTRRECFEQLKKRSVIGCFSFLIQLLIRMTILYKIFLTSIRFIRYKVTVKVLICFVFPSWITNDFEDEFVSAELKWSGWLLGANTLVTGKIEWSIFVFYPSLSTGYGPEF